MDGILAATIIEDVTANDPTPRVLKVVCRLATERLTAGVTANDPTPRVLKVSSIPE